MNDFGLKLRQEVKCYQCQELVASRSRIVAPTPCPPGGLLVIGEAPGAEEDQLGEGFVGQAGRVLDAMLVKHGLERNRDYGVANIIRCRSPQNRRPDRSEINACLPLLASFLMEWHPRVLLLVGASSAKVFLGASSLHWHIERSRQTGHILLVRDAHPALQVAIRTLHDRVSGVFAVPMPHTSGLAWNRKASDGRRWSEIGKEQVGIAVRLLDGGWHAP